MSATLTMTVTIFGMAIITFIIKAGIFILGDRVRFPLLLTQALEFVPVTVLTAIIVPMILSPKAQGLELSWHNPQLVASIVAVLVCVTTRRQLLTITVGLATFFGWQQWII
jgi:branched-subunit amino acid transport protein